MILITYKGEVKVVSAVTLDQVTKRYKDKNAVDNLSFSVETGTITALLGANGAGKTTSISMMLGLSRPTSGRVRLLGKDPTQPKNREQIGAMLQEVGLPKDMSVKQIINQFRNFYAKPLSTHHLLAIANLEKEAKKSTVKLSGGQKRRLHFALAMVGDPMVLFLDEPTTSMDISSRRNFWNHLKQFAKEKERTIILTTHHLEEADNITDRIIMIDQGKKVADGKPSDLKAIAGERYVSFTLRSDISDEQFLNLPYVDGLERSGRHIKIRTKKPDAVLKSMFEKRFEVEDYEVSSGGLEDAFMALTQYSDKEIDL